MRISARTAARLRRQVYTERDAKQEILAIKIRMAKDTVAHIKKELDPARRLRLQQGLARWEAAVDSLEDDGVYPEFWDEP